MVALLNITCLRSYSPLFILSVTYVLVINYILILYAVLNPHFLLVKTRHVKSPYKVIMTARSDWMISERSLLGWFFSQACNYYDVLLVLILSRSFLISSANVTILNILEFIYLLLNELVNTLKCFYQKKVYCDGIKLLIFIHACSF